MPDNTPSLKSEAMKRFEDEFGDFAQGTDKINLKSFISSLYDEAKAEIEEILPKKYEAGEYIPSEKKWIEGWNACLKQIHKNLKRIKSK